MRQMILDGLVVRLACGVNALPNEAVVDVRHLINALKTENTVEKSSNGTNDHIEFRVKYFHPKVTLNLELAILSEDLCSKRLSVTSLLERVIPNELLCIETQFLFRGLLMIEEDNFLSTDEWLKIWKCLMKVAKDNGDVSIDSIYIVLYHIAKEVDGIKQLELLRSMANFATVKVSKR